ncbi:hypothetical protein AWENTII_006440 [Aspergillus wentii]
MGRSQSVGLANDAPTPSSAAFSRLRMLDLQAMMSILVFFTSAFEIWKSYAAKEELSCHLPRLKIPLKSRGPRGLHPLEYLQKTHDWNLPSLKNPC